MSLRSLAIVSTVLIAGLAFFGGGRAARSEDKAAGNTVKLERLTWAQLQKRLANPRVKYTIVDAWSTTCGPCKENFPHVIEMHRKFADKGLAVISLSLDDPSDRPPSRRPRSSSRRRRRSSPTSCSTRAPAMDSIN